MRRKFTNDEERKAAKRAKKLASNTKRVAAGICLDCSNPVSGRRVCEACCRKSTIRKHKAGKFKTYQLGSKLSPERASYTLRLVKFTNPILRANWAEVSPWLEKHFELYAEHSDTALYNAIPLNMTGDVDSLDADEWTLRAYYQRIGSQATLEDFVIAKIDYEKELKCRTRTVEIDEQATKAPSERLDLTGRTSALR